MPQLCSQGQGKPGPVPPDFSAKDLISRQLHDAALESQGEDWDWPEANLVEPIVYVRGAKCLCLPSELKAVFPTHL